MLHSSVPVKSGWGWTWPEIAWLLPLPHLVSLATLLGSPGTTVLMTHLHTLHVSGSPSGEPILRQLCTECQQDEIKLSPCLFKNHSLELRGAINDKLQA